MIDITTQSESVADLMKAIAKAQAQIKNIPKSSVNPHFRSAYADMAAVRGEIYAALAAEGIAVLQPVTFEDGKVTVITELWLGDQYKRAPLSFPMQGNIQVFGSTVTYLKRYGITAMLSLAATDEDDDGNAATASANGKGTAPSATGPVSPAQAEEVRQTIVDVGADLPRFFKAFGIERIEEMPADRFAEAMRMLEMKRTQNTINRAPREDAE